MSSISRTWLTLYCSLDTIKAHWLQLQPLQVGVHQLEQENLWHQIRGSSTCSYVPQSMDPEFQKTVLCWHTIWVRRIDCWTLADMQNGTLRRRDILCCSFTGCRTTSYFKCLGMVKPLKEMQSIPCFIPVLGRLGASWEMPDNLMDEREAFRCAWYGNPLTTSVNELHYMKSTHLCDNTASTPEASISMQTYLLATDDWSNRSNVLIIDM